MTFIAPHYWKKRKQSLFQFLKRDRYLVKTPGWLRLLYPGCTWQMPAGQQTLYLTFDDGPHPVVTPFVLETLKNFNAKATFFCIGNNVAAQPHLYQRLLDEGHSVGNHTHNHVNGWKTPAADYVADYQLAAQHISSTLFRPPYGRISRRQIKQLKITFPGIHIIMWDVLSGDWEPHLSPEKCFGQTVRAVRDGSIIVFHDSEKAFERMRYALPRLLERFTQAGYVFAGIGNPTL